MNKFRYLILATLLFTQQAFAQIPYVQAGSKPGTDSGIVSLSSGGTFEVGAIKDRSIFCGYRGVNTSLDINFSENITCGFSCTPFTGVLAGDSDNGVDRSGTANDGIAFIAPSPDTFRITASTVSPNPSNVIIECFDTTLFGNFNTVTAANPFNFLEISNDSATTTTTGIVVLYANNGTEIARFGINLSPNQQKDISIHDVAGASNTFGRILLAHTGAPGSLRANLTKYTSSFAITASTPLQAKQNTL